MNNQINGKKQAGEAAAAYVKSGMTIGLGTGSTVRYAIEKIAARRKTEGLHIQGVVTSNRTSQLAQSLDIPLVSLEDVEAVDVTIDGADEIDQQLDGIKGGGGALLWEKVVASVSKQNIWVVDATKQVTTLGAFPLPVEVVPFAYPAVRRKLENEGIKVSARYNEGQYFETDSGNWILDLYLGAIENPQALESWLNLTPGVVENGLFLNRADHVVIGDTNGTCKYQRHNIS